MAAQGGAVLETVGVPLSGEPPRLLVNARDITEREHFETELAKARDAALTASQLKSAFLANMSHEDWRSRTATWN